MSELSEAIREGDAARLEALLDSDPAALHEAEGGVTPLLLALYHGRAELTQLLVARGAAVSFGEACALGDLDRVRRQLDADPSLLDTRTPDGYPPLGLAIFFRHPDVAAFLIEQGADVNAPAHNANGVAPVHAAAAVCDHATMRLLLEHGADPNARQQLDYTPLHGAASRGDLEMATLLLEHGADPTAHGSDGLTPAAIATKYGKSWL
jgi:ankyrin repeat protein